MLSRLFHSYTHCKTIITQRRAEKKSVSLSGSLSISRCANWKPFFCLQTMWMWEREENKVESVRQWAENRKKEMRDGRFVPERVDKSRRWTSAPNTAQHPPKPPLPHLLFPPWRITLHRFCPDFKSFLPIYPLLPLQSRFTVPLRPLCLMTW